MRIVGGRHRGRALAGIGKGAPAAHLRPTTDRVRESLFDWLAARGGDMVGGTQVLDLFAGTGALGLEALSRGTEAAVFVEANATARALLYDNIARLDAAGRAAVFGRDATRLGTVRSAPAGLVFLDPPYGKDLGPRALAAAAAGGWLAPRSVIVWEERTAQVAPAGFAPLDVRSYGDTTITFLEGPAFQGEP